MWLYDAADPMRNEVAGLNAFFSSMREVLGFKAVKFKPQQLRTVLLSFLWGE